jgi:hypothetical protein
VVVAGAGCPTLTVLPLVFVGAVKPLCPGPAEGADPRLKFSDGCPTFTPATEPEVCTVEPHAVSAIAPTACAHTRRETCNVVPLKASKVSCTVVHNLVPWNIFQRQWW